MVGSNLTGYLFRLALVAALSARLYSEDPKLREKAHDLLQKSATTVADENYRTPSYHLEAQFKLLGMEQHDLEGTYVNDFKSMEQWRTKVTAGDFAEIKVRNGDRLWWKRNADYVPFRLEQLLGSVPPQFWRLTDTDVVKSIDSSRIAGTDATCITANEVTGETKIPGEVCLDSTTGALLRHERGAFAYEYSRNSSFGKYILPGHVEVFDRGIKIAEADLKFSEPGPWTAAAFIAPADFESRKVCKRYIAPILIHQEPPIYPPGALQAGMSGVAGAKVHIGTDGRVYKPIITETAGSVLNAAALDAMKKWTFEPARCDGQPQDIETTLRVDFRSLRP